MAVAKLDSIKNVAVAYTKAWKREAVANSTRSRASAVELLG
jgi:hypothetical protein